MYRTVRGFCVMTARMRAVGVIGCRHDARVRDACAQMEADRRVTVGHASWRPDGEDMEHTAHCMRL